MLFIQVPVIICALFFLRHKFHKELPVIASSRTDSEPDQFPQGIRNLDNTCYLNAILQSLYAEDQYRSNVLATTFTEGSVGGELQNVFQVLGKSNVPRDRHFVDTSELAKQLGLNIKVQEDAEELLLNIVNKVDDSVVSTKNARLPSCAVRFNTTQRISCIEVDYSKMRRESYVDLSVDVEGNRNVLDALRARFKPEYLVNSNKHGNNQYRAGKHGLQNAVKRIFLGNAASITTATASSEGNACANGATGTASNSGVNSDTNNKARSSVQQQPPPQEHVDDVAAAGVPETLGVHLKRFSFDPQTMQSTKVTLLIF